VPWTLWGDHADVDTCGRLDRLKANIEAVGKHERLTCAEVRLNLGCEDGGRGGIGHQHHDDIGPTGCVGNRHDGHAIGFGFPPVLTALAQTDAHVHATVAEIECMRMPLGSVAQHRNFLRADQREVGVAIIKNGNHGFDSSFLNGD
jgi:hypothetical protein